MGARYPARGQPGEVGIAAYIHIRTRALTAARLLDKQAIPTNVLCTWVWQALLCPRRSADTPLGERTHTRQKSR